MTALNKGDDESSGAVPLGFTANLLGRSSSSIFINTNGAVTFGAPSGGYPGMGGEDQAGGPVPPLKNFTQPVIAAFLSDIDTSDPAVGAVTYGPVTINGRPAFVVNFTDVTFYSFSTPAPDLKRNSFQIVLLDRSDTGSGNFDIEFNYDKLQWETADSNGGINGLGDGAAAVGYTDGTGVPGASYELPGSHVPGSFSDGAPLSLVAGSNCGVTGRYTFPIRNGTAPAISSLNPPSTPAGAPLVLEVNGSGYLVASTILWNGTPLPTTFVSSNQLKASVPPGLIASPGLSVVTVNTNGTVSNTVNFTATTVASVAPSNVSVTPASGQGAAQTFSFVFRDPNGIADISRAQVHFQTDLVAENACYLQYTRSTNTVQMVADDGVGFVGSGATPGSAGSLSNSQCTLDAGGSSTTGQGNILTLNLALTFKPAFAGSKKISMSVLNNASVFSGWQQLGDWTATQPDALPPSSISVTPDSGGGTSQVFTFVYTDPYGYADLSRVQMHFQAQLVGENACYVQYTPSTNTAQLFDDAGAGFVGSGAKLGAAGSVANGQCTLDAGASSSTGQGNNLTVKLALTFKPAFAGVKKVSMGALNNAGLYSGWKALGDWTVTTAGPVAPANVSVSPNSGTGSSALFSLVYSDPYGYADIAMAQAHLQTQLVGENACYLQYTRATNTVQLFNDAGDGFVGSGATLGSASTLSNSQCSLNVGASYAWGQGNNLTLNLALTFNPAFSGLKIVSMGAVNVANQYSGWQAMGSWTIP